MEKKATSLYIMHTEDVYFHVPWYIRLIYIFKSPFDRVPPKQALEYYRIARIGKIINEKSPKIYNYCRDLLLPNLHEALADLKKAARFFYNALNRSINRDVPLTLMLRCITRDTGVLPQGTGGGEDWFVAYRKYWEQYLEDQFSEYKRHCQYDEMISALHEFFKGSGLKIISYAASRATRPDGFPLEETLALSVLKTFYLDVFLPDIHPILKIITPPASADI